ncbi:unnamed protein product [Durusdinium trenchii]|uniref:Uncharacterized protein n=1 Tax=Durusdinium trenchii TaxID=1381693 RepID=A0ABP0L8Q5_9DINO
MRTWRTTKGQALAIFCAIILITVAVFIIARFLDDDSVPPEDDPNTSAGQGEAPAGETPTDAPTLPSADASFATTTQRFFVDEPQPGSNSESFYVPLQSGTTGTVTKLLVRADAPFVNDSGSLRLWRYRKTASGGTFTKTAITPAIALDSSLPWSWWNDFGAQVDDAVELDPDTDMIAVKLDYTLPEGKSQSARAINVTFIVSSA